MNKFEKIRIRGYRRLLDTEIEMRPLTVMIGANGSGKTSLLEAWSLLAASCRSQLAETVSAYHGLNDILTRGLAQSLIFDVTMSVGEDTPLDYHVEIAPKGAFYTIAEETLIQKNGAKPQSFKHIQSTGLDIRYYNQENTKLLRPTWNHNPLETSLAQAPKTFEEPEALRARLASLTYYGPISVTPKAPVRLPQAMRPATLPGANGEDLVSALYYLRETDHDRFEIIEDTSTAAFPDFERLEFPPVAAGVLPQPMSVRN